MSDQITKSRKELREEYKRRKFRIGVFQIRNTVTGKIYVDSSVNLDAIWNRHLLQLEFGGHQIALLQSDCKEFGKEAFVFEVLAEVEQKDEVTNYDDELAELKQLFIDDLQPFEEKGYNKRVIKK
jgi:group I intron endonuclease